MTFKNYYGKLQRSPITLRDRIVSECDISTQTFYNILTGKVRPSKLVKEKISEITGIPVTELFPE